ncbi:hypothetical protein H1R20_g7469, partial [Candolleomyces eurysporus]
MAVVTAATTNVDCNADDAVFVGGGVELVVATGLSSFSIVLDAFDPTIVCCPSSTSVISVSGDGFSPVLESVLEFILVGYGKETRKRARRVENCRSGTNVAIPLLYKLGSSTGKLHQETTIGGLALDRSKTNFKEVESEVVVGDDPAGGTYSGPGL